MEAFFHVGICLESFGQSLCYEADHFITGLTAEQARGMIGASRSTARRYLETLVAQGEVLADLPDGVVWRPERVYRSMRQKK